MKTNVLDFIEFAVGHAAKTYFDGNIIGRSGLDPWQYLWGTYGQKVTPARLETAWKHYKANGWSREDYDEITQPWLETPTIVTDCNGLLDAYAHEDKNANYTYQHCTQRGLIAAINRPFIVGEAVFNGSATKKTHVGWVCGFKTDGTPLVVEARGIRYGVVITSMATRTWKYRGLMTERFEYADAPIQPGIITYCFTRTLKAGMKGDDVIELKRLLIAHGYADGISIDGKSSNEFGAKTRVMVRCFQTDAGLTVDGKAGPKTIRALGGIYK